MGNYRGLNLFAPLGTLLVRGLLDIGDGTHVITRGAGFEIKKYGVVCFRHFKLLTPGETSRKLAARHQLDLSRVPLGMIIGQGELYAVAPLTDREPTTWTCRVNNVSDPREIVGDDPHPPLPTALFFQNVKEFPVPIVYQPAHPGSIFDIPADVMQGIN